jgi:hypothetical protein
MRRTQIYLTEQQDQRIDALARSRGVSKAAVIRGMLDAGLDLGGAEADAVLAISSTAGICADYPDWPEWLDEVRATAADDRLTQLGL